MQLLRENSEVLQSRKVWAHLDDQIWGVIRWLYPVPRNRTLTLTQSCAEAGLWPGHHSCWEATSRASGSESTRSECRQCACTCPWLSNNSVSWNEGRIVKCESLLWSTLSKKFDTAMTSNSESHSQSLTSPHWGAGEDQKGKIEKSHGLRLRRFNR